MSIIARQSTARTVIVGPILDADGVAVTDATVGDLKISVNGGAPAGLNGSATLTHRNTGHYSLALTATDLATVGQAEVVIDDTTNAMPVKVITVVEEAVYDALFAASATGLLPANVTQWKGAAPADLADTDKVQVSAQHMADGLVTAAKLATDAITAAKVADSAVAKIEAALLNEGDGHALIDAIVQAIDDADISTNLTVALIRDGILNRVLAGNHDTAGTVGKVLQDAATSAELSDLQDHGDANWPTATGFSTHGAADVWSNGTRSLTDKAGFGLADGAITDAKIADGAITAAKIATGAISAVKAAADFCNKVADHVRRRTQANVEASSDGDALSLGSEYGLIQQAQEASVSGSTMTVNRTDKTTSLGTRTVATDENAEPITGVS